MLRTLFFCCLALALLFACGTPEESAQSRAIIHTAGAPAAIGPYSQAVLSNGTLYCSGQIPIDPQTGEMVTESIEAETRQVLENLGAVLHEAGMDYNDVVRATVYMADLSDYQRMNVVYAEFFGEAKPARAAVQVAKIPRGARVEISCIAVKK